MSLNSIAERTLRASSSPSLMTLTTSLGRYVGIALQMYMAVGAYHQVAIKHTVFRHHQNNVPSMLSVLFSCREFEITDGFPGTVVLCATQDRRELDEILRSMSTERFYGGMVNLFGNQLFGPFFVSRRRVSPTQSLRGDYDHRPPIPRAGSRRSNLTQGAAAGLAMSTLQLEGTPTSTILPSSCRQRA
ncbi:hypothetical protein BJ912DRAFT_1063562 [Pholiota molesta]|nr:hypothetical protein BJ912DRAFT_1063562 [Pholiota molesta]